MDRIKTAKQLLKLAKSLIAESNAIGEAYYHVMDEATKTISVIFFIGKTHDAEMFWNWMDYAKDKPSEVEPIAKKYGFVYQPHTTDAGVHLDGTIYDFVYVGGENADMEGFKAELAETFGCKETK